MVNPDTVVVVAGGVPDTVVGVWATPPMNGVTVYDVIPEPPLAGAAHDTVAEPLPAVADTPVGVPGAVGPDGVTALDAADSGPVPIAFVALTLNVYAVPLLRPVIVVLVPEATVFGVWAAAPTYGVTV